MGYSSPERKKEAVRKYRQTPKGKAVYAGAMHRYRLKTKYGITPEEYNDMLAKQGGGCAICGGVCKTGERLSVDHDHETGAVRGLLCRNCNAGLGNFGDHPDLLRLAMSYLERNI